MPQEQAASKQDRLLLAAPTLRDGEITTSIMAGVDILCVACADLHHLSVEIANGVGAILLSEHAFAAAGMDQLIATLNNQASWSEIPVIALLQGGIQSNRAVYVLNSLRNATLLERPTPMRSIVSTVQAALRARRRQYEIRDHIEEIRQSRERAKVLQNQLEVAINASELGTFNWDLISNQITWNDRCKALFGLAPETELNIDLFHSLIHPDDRDTTRQALQNSFDRGTLYDVEYRVLTPQGQTRWIRTLGQSFKDAQGRATRFDGTAQDITECKLAEEELRETQSRFQAMANSIPQLAWMARSDGWIFWYNRQWHDYCGTTDEQMQGWGWRAVHEQSSLPRVIDNWTRAIETGEPWEDTFRLRRHDGQYRWHLSRARPFRDAAGNIALWFGTNTDVTEERNKAEEREQLLQREQAARLESDRAGKIKDEFLATLSHELRTPLNAILGWSQLIRRADGDSELLNEGINVIERNTRVQVQLIEDLLDMSRIISGKIRLKSQALQAVSFVDAAMETVQPTAKAKGVRLTKIVPEDSMMVTGDSARLQQVVWNLLSNAIKFTPAGGEVKLTMQQVDAQVQISVADTGNGIDQQFLPHVFERFRQADASTTRAHGGLGLGLAIVKHLVGLHEGSVIAASEGVGQGSTFTVLLPIAQPAATHEENGGASGESFAGSNAFDRRSAELGGIKILVVDDEPDARRLIKRLLEGCNAKVFTADSAHAALSIIEADRPDVMLSDIGMPIVDGYELLHRVRALGHDRGGSIPAIALTAFARAEDRARALNAGFLLHITKPLEPRELIATLANIAAAKVVEREELTAAKGSSILHR